MASNVSQANIELYEPMNISYEQAYGNNPLKKECIAAALKLLPAPGIRVLDIGCGTGLPVAQMFSEAGHTITGIDISPAMVELASSRIRGRFMVGDVLSFQPDGSYAVVLILFAHCHLDYASFHSAVYRFASALEPGGLFIVGQMPSNRNVLEDDPAYDRTGSYVEHYPAPFMGGMYPTLMMSIEGQRKMLTSMNLDILYENIGHFQPAKKGCKLEHQQYIIAKRPDDQPLEQPLPLPVSRLNE